MKLLIGICFLLSCTVHAQQLKPLSTYLSHPKLSTQAKYFYKNLPRFQKDHQVFYSDPKNESVTISIMQNALTGEPALRPFYLYLMNRNLEMVDGSLQLTAMFKQYEIIGKKPAIFFQYMIDNPSEKEKYFKRWAELMTVTPEQYCENSDYKGDPDCLVNFRKNSLRLLAGNFKLKALASAFFDQMMIAEARPKTLELNRSYHGKAVFVATGQPVKINFRECRGCASVWKIADKDKSKIFFIRDEYSNPSCVDCTGGNQDHSIYFSLLSNDKTSISFTYFEEIVTIRFIPY